MFEKIKDLFTHRMTVWFVLGLVFLGAATMAVEALALPPLFQVALYKGFLLFAASHAGYWVDRVLFPYARPDQILHAQELETEIDLNDLADDDGVIRGAVCTVGTEPSFDAACLRRAIIVAAVMVCVAFGA
jgi:hypothetical protein